MYSFARKTLMATALVLVATAAQAQERREKELRIDLVGFETVDGNSQFGIGIPAVQVALGIYLNKNIAIEPTVGFVSFSGNGNSSTVMELGVFVPYYLKGDAGRSGLFISPGLMYGKIGGDNEQDGTIDFGVDVGLKKTWHDNVVMRGAVTVRTGDSYEDGAGDSQIGIGAMFGLGIFWR